MDNFMLEVWRDHFPWLPRVTSLVVPMDIKHTELTIAKGVGDCLERPCKSDSTPEAGPVFRYLVIPNGQKSNDGPIFNLPLFSKETVLDGIFGLLIAEEDRLIQLGFTEEELKVLSDFRDPNQRPDCVYIVEKKLCNPYKKVDNEPIKEVIITRIPYKMLYEKISEAIIHATILATSQLISATN